MSWLSFLCILAVLAGNSFGQQLEYKSNGVRGERARDGVDGSSGSYGGGDGGDGTNATRPTDAVPAGPIVIELAEQEDGTVKIVGEVRDHAGNLIRKVDDTFVKDDAGNILIDTSGLEGGAGGRGGDGGRGGKGSSGMDATRFSSGTDGGRGGRGGDAGDGSSGAKGGNAAASTIVLDETHTHFLMLIDENSPGILDGDIPGGPGGPAGAPGRPGGGGPGGARK